MYPVMQADATSTQFILTFGGLAAGLLISWLTWLTLRHFNYALPTYKRVFGDDDHEIDGHISESKDRFDTLDESHKQLADRVDRIHDEMRKVEQRQDTVLSNQKKMADGLGIDLDRPRFYRGAKPSDEESSGD